MLSFVKVTNIIKTIFVIGVGIGVSAGKFVMQMTVTVAETQALPYGGAASRPRLLRGPLSRPRVVFKGKAGHSACRGLRVDCTGALRGYRGGTGGPD